MTPEVTTLIGAGAVSLLSGVVVALANHFFTRNRERGAWLRELQVEANRDLYAAAQELMTLVTTANPDYASHEFGWDPERLSHLIAALNHSVLKMMQVGEDETLEMSYTLVATFPCLAYQALPLPGTVHDVALEQREKAIQAMSGLLAEVAAVMRNDIGLLSRKEHREAKKLRPTRFYLQQRLSPVDRPGAHLGVLLFGWQVLTLDGAIPDTIAAYDVEEISMTAPEGFDPQACLVKPHTGPWHFAVKRDLHPNSKNNITADALRLVTGHSEAFRPLHNPKRVGTDPGRAAYVWFDVLP